VGWAILGPWKETTIQNSLWQPILATVQWAASRLAAAGSAFGKPAGDHPGILSLIGFLDLDVATGSSHHRPCGNKWAKTLPQQAGKFSQAF